MKKFLFPILLLLLGLRISLPISASYERNALLTSSSDDEFDDEEGSEEEQENEEIEENA